MQANEERGHNSFPGEQSIHPAHPNNWGASTFSGSSRQHSLCGADCESSLRWRLRGKLGIKMLFPIVIFILPVLFVITLVPGMLSVLKDLKLLGAGR